MTRQGDINHPGPGTDPLGHSDLWRLSGVVVSDGGRIVCTRVSDRVVQCLTMSESELPPMYIDPTSPLSYDCPGCPAKEGEPCMTRPQRRFRAWDPDVQDWVIPPQPVSTPIATIHPSRQRLFDQGKKIIDRAAQELHWQARREEERQEMIEKGPVGWNIVCPTCQAPRHTPCVGKTGRSLKSFHDDRHLLDQGIRWSEDGHYGAGGRIRELLAQHRPDIQLPSHDDDYDDDVDKRPDTDRRRTPEEIEARRRLREKWSIRRSAGLPTDNLAPYPHQDDDEWDLGELVTA